jgi:ribonuclease HII
MPESYNYEYNKMEERGKNLNHLLGNLHGKNIKCLLLKYKCPCIIVDKFGKDEYVLTALGSVAAGKTIIQVTKGERDTAVAAASVLARAAFIESMNELEDRFHMSFPKGAFAGIETALTAFCGTYGNKELYKVGKLNFKTFDSLR